MGAALGLGEQRVPVRRALVPAPPGWIRARYMLANGEYLGEIELFAVNVDAAKGMLDDLLQHIKGPTGGIVQAPPGFNPKGSIIK
jgi:hypothetical protein